jgi:hypothetical protein
MVAITAKDSIDSPARRPVRRSTLIVPVNVPAFVDEAHLRAALAGSGEGS